MTILTQGASSYFLTTRPILLEDDRDVADSWASKHITANAAIKWVLGKYCEADHANSNGQYWSLEDLRMKSPTILHAPMNINHLPNKIVGTYVGTEMMYPVNESAEDNPINPYIETVAAFWRAYNQDLLPKIEEAYNDGSLFQSMECVSESVTCMEGCGETFPYAGPRSESYCNHINAGGVRGLNNPHFLAGALIIPPTRPGWEGAVVKDLIKANQEEAERIYEEVSQEASHLNPQQWESLMLQLLHRAHAEDKMPADAIGRRIARETMSRYR